MLKKIGRLCAIQLLTFLAGAVGSYAVTPENLAWYHQLHLPFFTPPSWTFSVVWTILYGMMATAAWLVIEKKGFLSTPAYWYYTQLIVNALYTPLFFKYRLIGFSTVWILLLILLILKTRAVFIPVDQRAGWLLIPYLAWSSYAFFLSLSVAALNII